MCAYGRYAPEIWEFYRESGNLGNFRKIWDIFGTLSKYYVLSNNLHPVHVLFDTFKQYNSPRKDSSGTCPTRWTRTRSWNLIMPRNHKNHVGSPCSLLRCPGNGPRKFGSIILVNILLSWWILLVSVRQTVREKLCISVPLFRCPPLAVDKTKLHPSDFSATFSSGGLGWNWKRHAH